jgi:carbamoyltransferase
MDGVGAKYRRATSEAELLDQVAALLAQEKIVGWFQGRMEFGPRALGARSILGDPRSPKMQATMNLKIKFRESFRPFAPIVLRDEAHKWFALDAEARKPYMLLVAPVLDAHRVPVTEAQQETMRTTRTSAIASTCRVRRYRR